MSPCMYLPALYYTVYYYSALQYIMPYEVHILLHYAVYNCTTVYYTIYDPTIQSLNVVSV